nr:MAG TPA: hypothetical protein [Caudoviricetes sp.]
MPSHGLRGHFSDQGRLFLFPIVIVVLVIFFDGFRLLLCFLGRSFLCRGFLGSRFFLFFRVIVVLVPITVLVFLRIRLLLCCSFLCYRLLLGLRSFLFDFLLVLGNIFLVEAVLILIVIIRLGCTRLQIVTHSSTDLTIVLFMGDIDIQRLTDHIVQINSNLSVTLHADDLQQRLELPQSLVGENQIVKYLDTLVITGKDLKGNLQHGVTTLSILLLDVRDLDMMNTLACALECLNIGKIDFNFACHNRYLQNSVIFPKALCLLVSRFFLVKAKNFDELLICEITNLSRNFQILWLLKLGPIVWVRTDLTDVSCNCFINPVNSDFFLLDQGVQSIIRHSFEVCPSTLCCAWVNIWKNFIFHALKRITDFMAAGQHPRVLSQAMTKTNELFCFGFQIAPHLLGHLFVLVKGIFLDPDIRDHRKCISEYCLIFEFPMFCRID